MTNSESGIMIAAVPIIAKFKRDSFNEGVVAQWYLPEFNDNNWEIKIHFISGTSRTNQKINLLMIMMTMAGTNSGLIFQMGQ